MLETEALLLDLLSIAQCCPSLRAMLHMPNATSCC
jgi:hypothetical protein